MNIITAPEAAIGHNSGEIMKPTSEIISNLDAELFAEQLRNDYPEVIARVNELHAGYQRFMEKHPNGIPSQEVYESLATFGGQLQKSAKSIEASRTALSAPVKAVFDVINDFFKRNGSDVLTEDTKSLGRVASAWQVKLEAEERAKREEEARRAREEARLAAEFAAKTQHPDVIETAIEASVTADKAAVAAVASTADLVRQRGSQGGMVTARVEWTFGITDETLIPRMYWILDDKKIAATVRAQKEDTNIPGIKVIKGTKANFR